MPSCMRAPPEEVKMMTGSLFSAPTSMARMIFSPTTEPMLPPMKRKSMTARTTSCPLTLQSPVTTASLLPVLRAAASTFCS